MLEYIYTFFTQNQIPDLFHDAAKIDDYSETEGVVFMFFSFVSHGNISKTLRETYLQGYSTVKSFRHLCKNAVK